MNRYENLRSIRMIAFSSLLLLLFSCAKEQDPEPDTYLVLEDGTFEFVDEDNELSYVYDAVTDFDGNSYDAVKIGNQTWMAENLRTTRYADGTYISSGSGSSETAPHWYYPGNNSFNISAFGLLYNWKAVMRNSSSSNSNPSGVQGICPNGWHVPSDAEWKQMEIAVGMSQSDADHAGWRGSIAAQLCGNTGWTFSSTTNAAGNTSATGRNSSGFSALPAGYYYFGSYDNFGYGAVFWSATEYNGKIWTRFLEYNCAQVYRDSDYKSYGYSVRCVKD